MSDSNKLLCYNRGCGQTFDPDKNTPKSCCHHSGVPVFHDAYKGWSCCKKKCTDFTEFLNIKGCELSYHSNVKPPEPEKPTVQLEIDTPPVPAPTPAPVIERPPFDTPMVNLKPEVSQTLRDLLLSMKITQTNEEATDTGNIPIGTLCKNNACKKAYEGENSLLTSCVHHPGYPVFHEGLKFWSCCTKKTTDFETFLGQVGCTTGEHVWHEKKETTGEVTCRLDWHQTSSHVYISVFAKKCDPDSSLVQLSPVRLKFSLNLPEHGGKFVRDMELKGVVDVEKSSLVMTPSKIEIKLKKAGGGSWSHLDIPRNQTTPKVDSKPVVDLPSQVESVDLSDL